MAGTVTVACKLPNGLILQTFAMVEHDEPVFGGGVKKVMRAVKTPHPPVKINGSARYAGRDLPHDIKMGYGLTYGVDADFFNEWLRQNKDEPYVKNNLIFAQPSAKNFDLDAQIKDNRERKSGLEPLDMNNLPKDIEGKVQVASDAA